MQGEELLSHELLTELAGKYSKSPVQIILRWDLQYGIVAILKSVTPARIREKCGHLRFRVDGDGHGKKSMA